MLDQNVYGNPRIPASAIVELISLRAARTSSTYIFDLAEQVGVGALVKEWAASASESVVSVQTRTGAGLGIVGRLSEGPSGSIFKNVNLAVFTTPTGLSMMSPSLTHLPPAAPANRLVIHMPNVTPIGPKFKFSPSLSPLAPTWSTLPPHILVILSSTPQQTADFADLAHNYIQSHVIHIFDQFRSARETGHFITPLPNDIYRQDDTVSALQVIDKAGYRLFDKCGADIAHTAIVFLNGPLARSAAALASRTMCGLAVVVVNVFRPWDERTFADTLPGSVTDIHVIDEVPHSSTQGCLYVDVFSTLLGRKDIMVHGHRFTPEKTQEYIENSKSLLRFMCDISPAIQLERPLFHSLSKRILIFSRPRSSFSMIPGMAENLLVSNSKISAHGLMNYDMLSAPGGVGVFRLDLSQTTKVEDPHQMIDKVGNLEDAVDFLAVLDQNLLSSHDLLRYAKQGSMVLLVAVQALKDLILEIPSETKILCSNRKLRVFSVNVKVVSSNLPEYGISPEFVQNLLVYLVFVRLYLGIVATECKVYDVVKPLMRGFVDEIALKRYSSAAWSGLREITFDPADEDLKHIGRPSLKEVNFNAIAVDTGMGNTLVNGVKLSSWHDAAKHCLFSSIFSPQTQSDSVLRKHLALRPEHSERTFLVTCTVNRRLTPVEYDRNIFHLEFDTTGTGLTYAVGEALGVHGWNDEKEVLDFCAWYDVDPSRLLTIPVPGTINEMHTRTVLQALQQQIDLFGHPPKSFYTDLAVYAQSSVDRHALLFIGSPEGTTMYKKLSEKDTVTYVDVLMKYTSAKPGIERLCELIGDIKPRHYSIASAQSAVGDSVHLLVVTVQWKTPSGILRQGQCTRYLAGLRVGQKVTVSIKPSVMKLPPDPKQPLILAGLGTGAAPFRAFFQHLACLASEGQDIGPVYYYFGSRHQASEYLYGEEIESYVLDGVISRAGLAFSRDGARKVYIQHKMLEDSEALSTMLSDHQGVFYLCGPTWPVPDVYEALVNALVRYKGMDSVKAGQYLENLKEEERYVLEVY